MPRSIFFSLGLLSQLLLLGACTRQSATSGAEASAPAATASLAPSPTAPTCEHPFGLSESMELIYQVKDGQDKLQQEVRNRVVKLGSRTNKKGEFEATTVLLKSGIYSADNKLLHQQDLTFYCQQDTAFTDGMMEMNFDNLKSFRDRYFDYAPTGVAWPNQPQTGSKLPDGGVSVNVHSSAVDIAKVYTTVRNRRVVSGPESITTPAGTFSCYKVESERESAIRPKPDIVKRTIVQATDYYSPSVGLVRSEWHDKNHKLLQTCTLTQRVMR